MSAYLISHVRAEDPRAFEAYRVRAAASIALHGGRCLARDGAIQVIEGWWAPQTIVIVAFDTAARAAAWYDSPEHAEALALRADPPGRDLILVDRAAADSD